MPIPQGRVLGIKLVLSPELQHHWPFYMDRVQREAERMISEPACLSVAWAEERVEGWHVAFRIETMREGMAEFRA